jgi:hypothetical protein
MKYYDWDKLKECGEEQVEVRLEIICRKSNCANHRCENRKHNFSVLFHTRFNVRTLLKLRERFGSRCKPHSPPAVTNFRVERRTATLLHIFRRRHTWPLQLFSSYIVSGL